MAASNFKRPPMGLTATHRAGVRQRGLRGSDNPWKDKDTPVRQGKPARPSRSAGGSFGAGGTTGLAGVGSAAGAGRLASRLAAAAPPPPPSETTITDPINVTLLDELSPPEAAPEPRWSTFCSHLEGQWVGQYGAYTPWEGKPEPAWMDERGKYITLVYTRALEQRVKYPVVQDVNGDGEHVPAGKAAAGAGAGHDEKAAAARVTSLEAEKDFAGALAHEADLLVRKIGRCTKLAALSDLRLRPPAAAAAAATPVDAGATDGEPSASGAGMVYDILDEEEEEDVDVEALTFNSDGVVVFDGGNYSAGPEYIGQQPIKLVNSDTIMGLSEDDQADDDVAAAAARARSGAAASTSASLGGAAKAKSAAAAAAAASRGAAATYGMNNNSGGDDDGDDDEDDDADGDEEDSSDATLLPTSTSVFEQCLVDWGSRSRMRLKLTLRIGQLENGEVDVEVLRILLFTEEWVGPASAVSPPSQVKILEKPCTALPRPTPVQLQLHSFAGSWNVFTTCATSVDEVDPRSGEEQVVWVYSSTEEQQLWDTSALPPSGDDGGCFWLPGGVVLSLRMVDNYVPVDLDLDSESGGSGSESDRGGGGASTNGNGNGNGLESSRTYPRGLCLGMAWLWREGSVSVLEREYDGYGYLREVRLSQGVKGGWAGGRM
ncbi:hypothetical protein VOLCADRAFT_93813 [Volvox carteri f. nagariensis]|uniref:DUF3598 domain-containing protein n=1 Tax=Volvox carteri f. nagariensis TaxID=3068 RepID=D8U347_VOLCA|nr:uncharacterized protein VOLCADRAFT_93813 [Volvox carteri f. nagariensis]EFJ46014.1 hypothetical protein VOLCADRAFT_93813 [Volvox carteri f. nagariensis]|eukprot:XP_002953092.1 hypothetical protein VOLCADRAFT_93813 [Volvox carteri f. nagariensis]